MDRKSEGINYLTPLEPSNVRRLTRVAAFVAPATSILLFVTMAVLTTVEREFPRSVGWSPIGRSPTQWPSLLALGPGGQTIIVVFALAGVGASVIGIALLQTDKANRVRIAGLCVLASAIGLFGVAFPADLPDAEPSWHAAIHNSFYPLIPLGITVGAAVLGWGGPQVGRPSVPFARALVIIMLLFFIGSGVASVAQLSRYFAFAAMLTWAGLLGPALSRASSGTD